MRKKVGTPILGSPGLKLFEPVAVEFMLQELEFHIPHVQPGSYFHAESNRQTLSVLFCQHVPCRNILPLC